MEESGRPAVRSEPDHEDCVLVLQPEQRVECHHKSLLRLVTPPFAGNQLEIGSELAGDLAGVEHAHGVPLALEALHRLSDLADRTAFERERSRLEHRLVAVEQRLQPEPAVQVEVGLDAPELRSASPANRRGR